MTEVECRGALLDMVRSDNSLRGGCDWVSWPQYGDETRIGLDGTFTADQLEAMAWWMRNKEYLRE